MERHAPHVQGSGLYLMATRGPPFMPGHAAGVLRELYAAPGYRHRIVVLGAETAML